MVRKNGMNDKCKLVLQVTVISLLCVLFVGSFTYILPVYFSFRNKEVQNEFLLTEICHPYAALSNISQSGINQDPETVLTNLSLVDIYRNYPKCVDVLLPVICQMFYPVIKLDSDVVHSGSGVDDTRFINTLLLEECTSVIPNQLLQLLKSLPTAYFQNIACADGFYSLNNTCRPHCSQFEEINHKDAQIRIGFWYFVAISNIVFTLLFIAVSCFKRKTMLKFPSILIVYIVIVLSTVPTSILISLLSGRTLLCSYDDLLKSLEQPTPYCIISGILNCFAPSITWLWFILVAVMFWKLLFPFHARRHHNFEKWIHILAIVVPFLYLIVYVIVSTTNEDFYNIQYVFPSFSCATRNNDFYMIYILFPAIFLCSLGVFLLFIILFNIQLRYGCSIWRNNDVINTAEKKIIFLLCLVSIICTIAGVYNTLILSGANELQAARNRYLLCELPGYIIGNVNDMITCSKSDVKKYSYTDLYIPYIIFRYPVVTLTFLLTVIEWGRFIKKTKGLFNLINNRLTSFNLRKDNEISLSDKLELSSTDTM